MTRPALTSSTAIIAALAIATPASADLTADDVYQNWIETAEAGGQTVDVAEMSKTGGRIDMSGIVTTVEQPDGTVTVTVGRASLIENGDGSVGIEVDSDYDIRVVNRLPDGEETIVEMTLTHSALEMVATGDPDAISYALDADRMEAVLDSITEDGEPQDMDLAMGVDGLSGTYDVSAGTPHRIDSDFSADAAAFTMSVNAPEEDTDVSIRYTVEEIATNTTGTLSPLSAGQDLSGMLAAGLLSEGSLTFGPSQYEIDANTIDGQTIIEGSTGSSTLDFAVGEDGLRYGGVNKDLAMTVIVPGAMMPPISVTAEETSGEVVMPLAESEEASEFALNLALIGVEVGEQLWSMIDPTGGIPRDPAKLVLDITGMGNWLIDLGDPDAMTSVEELGEMPGEVESVEINALELGIAGAELTGDGSFAFDNATVPPVPSGVVNLQLVGANALIDTLIGVGLLPEDQAMGARMMLGLFARPGEGEDTLVSTIEIKEDGAILANGQRIR